MSRPLTIRVVTATAMTAVAAGMLVLPSSPAFAAKYQIVGTTRTDENVHLHNLVFKMHFPDTSKTIGEPLADIAASSFGMWIVESKDDSIGGSSLEVRLQYEIYDRDDKPTGYWVDAAFSRPSMSSNDARCWIFKDSPDKPIRRKVVNGPYACGWSNYQSGDWNPRPYLDVRIDR